MPNRKALANAIRVLSMDAVQKAKSGHPGAPMGMADIAEVLWNDFLKHNPKNPNWSDRDRFVLSNGHGSMLIYSLLHLSGYDLSIDDLKQFRQLHSKTPGHPEYGYAPGVETTTGPLGQGITNAVGMAIAEKSMAAQFNRGVHNVVDHYTYTFLGDGCLMEGISHEACSLAGTLELGKLIAFYDDNNISIDGEVRGGGDAPAWFTDNTPMRFESYGWHVISEVDGHDAEAIHAAIEAARAETQKPTLICCQTMIGYGSPNKQGSESCHGAPLGDDEIAATRAHLGWSAPAFEIPDDIASKWNAAEKGLAAEASWSEKMEAYRAEFPELANELERRMAGDLPADWADKSQQFIDNVTEKQETIASRKASQNALNGFGPLLPELMGGSADLAGSNLTIWSGAKGISAKDASGNYLFYGVREFAMSAIMNGIALHGGFRPYGATFLMFMEYARNAVRMAALMKIPSIFVYTHDSIGLGEDGPTHQPVEQMASLRLTPNVDMWRPCDAVESAISWQQAIERKDGPSSLIFSRQNLTAMPRDKQQLADVKRGGYILSEAKGELAGILIATGSEVELAMKAQESLQSEGVFVRVVSMPCTDVFEKQDAAYRESVLPAAISSRVAVEAGIADYWYKYVGLNGAVVGMQTFGESGPAGQVFEYFGFSVDNVIKTMKSVL